MTLCLTSFSMPSLLDFSLVATFEIIESLSVVILPLTGPKLTELGALVSLFGHE